jgi:signal transduction histidine kinase
MAQTISSARPDSLTSLQRLRRATFLLLLTFIAIMVGAGIYHLSSQYNDAVETAFRTARSTTLTVESHAARTFGETYKVLSGIADVYRVANDLGGVDEEYLHGVMAEKLADMPYVSTFFIVHPDGRVVASGRQFPTDRTVDLFAMTPTRPPADDSLDYVGALYRGAANGGADTWFLPIGRKILDKDGRLAAAAVAIVRPAYFSNFYETLDVGPAGRVTMWTADGHLVASMLNERSRIGDHDPEIVQYVSAMRERAGNRAPLVYAARMGGVREVNAHGQVGDLPFIVSVYLNGDDYLVGWRQTRDRIMAGILAIIFAMGVFTVIILKQLDRAAENEEALRHAKAVAEDANDAKSRFLAHMSHEFRTPLNAIMGFSDIIKGKVMGDVIAPVYTSYAEHIHRSGEHLLNIVNDILDMAKIESGAQSVQHQAVDMAGVVDRAISFVEQLAAQSDLRIDAAVAPRLPRVTGDERFIRQVLINLLSNAIKFSPPAGRVLVRADITAYGDLDVSVTDQGSGIAPMILKRIGEPFLQGDPALSRAGQGTGLGLSICKHYMDLLGGELLLESSPGSGTTATMRFPPALLTNEPASA